jgi:hypothetical protein
MSNQTEMDKLAFSRNKLGEFFVGNLRRGLHFRGAACTETGLAVTRTESNHTNY